jgi:hypothetical protein
VDTLARADASSMVAGGGTPSQMLSPLLESLLLPSAVLGPEFHRLNQAFATIDPKFLNFESDDDEMGERDSASLPLPTPPTPGASGAVLPNPSTVRVSPDAPVVECVLSDEEIERRVEVVLGLLHPPTPPAPYMDGAPGASLWNPDVDVVSIDTIHPQDVPLMADILSLSCVIAQRTQDVAHCDVDNTHDTFVDKPYRLYEDFFQPVPPPSPGTVACTVFPAQAPHVIVREVQAVEHVLLMAGHWLTMVDISSVLLHEQQGLFALAAAVFAVANDRFPAALPHEPSCPLSHKADMMPLPSPLEGVPASPVGSPTASGSGPMGHASSAPSARPHHKRCPAKH